jgi:hypothetical protein
LKPALIQRAHCQVILATSEMVCHHPGKRCPKYLLYPPCVVWGHAPSPFLDSPSKYQ